MSFLELQTTFKVDIWKCATLCRSATNSNNRNRLRLSKDGMKPCRCVPSWRTTIIILRSFLPNPTHHRVDLGLASIRQLSVSNMLLKGAAQKQPGSDLIPEGLAVTAQCLNVSAERQGSSSNVMYYIFIQKNIYISCPKDFNYFNKSLVLGCCREEENLQPLTLTHFFFSSPHFALLARFSLIAVEGFAGRAVKWETQRPSFISQIRLFSLRAGQHVTRRPDRSCNRLRQRDLGLERRHAVVSNWAGCLGNAPR